MFQWLLIPAAVACRHLTSTQKVLIYISHIKKVIADLYSFAQ